MLIPSIVSAQAAPFEAPKVRSRVVISEVMWAGSEISSADEWLEIANISDEEINLEGWTITKRASDGGNVVMISFPEDAIIGVGELYLIANYDTDQSTLETSPDLVTTAVSLSNTKLYLQLIDTEGEVIDAVDDGVGAPFAGGKTPFVSMERIDLFASGEDRENWRSGGGESEECEDCEEGEDSSISSSSSLSSFSSPSSFSFVRITEVLLDPEISEDYEWIELGNLGEESVDITGWILSDGSRSHTIEPRSQSGYILEPGEHTLFFHYQTGIALSNQGEIIVLRSLEREIDRIDVSETGEEISFGREPDGSRGPFCIPTPREPNAEKKLNPQIEVQSGRSTDYTKVTLN
ncbi:MAG: lamin tail domain-containing protein, partial [Candidatus Peribacteraceae bacterium]|nr:lamin tail domain-containing protein [Candidatus Peribacteraceae bacterium]